ncbi:MAG: hypothetical protein LBK57_01630 [Clostridiales Family XIII bacterium]|jgi:hypothetical protein|nr:hypothetical protein [Clostridiales Family XIII bacterium]
MSKTIGDLWESNKDAFEDKTLAQILKFSGDGKLKDENNTCKEFRSFLNILPTDKLALFANECLETTFDSAAYALQDIVNELGTRIGFNVERCNKKQAQQYRCRYKLITNNEYKRRS